MFWVHAGSTARLEHGFQELAEQARVPGRKDPQANIFKLVRDWLNSRRSGQWLLILDNVDETHFLPEAANAAWGGQGVGGEGKARQPMSAYLPVNPNGAILVSSRSRSVALKLVEEKEIIIVEPMTQPHALALF